ncbi:putative vinorine synthase [Helianthus annuus]|nr:putative vinorine synthase [Helianthus annuus]
MNNIIKARKMKLHIISTEIIKLSSPTPSHLKTYNLSLIDQTMNSNNFIPLLLFYPNTENRSFHAKTLDMKNSLSQILTKYYPFAGRYAKAAPAHVDCNDDGAEFLAGSIDTTLSDFLQNSQHEDLDQFFPYRQVWFNSDRKTESDQVMIPLAVQINHFECGGVAVAVSLSTR